MKNCFIFDLDGTLTNTLETISYFVNLTLTKYELKNIETEKFKLLAGDGARNLIRRSIAFTLKSWSKEFEDKVLTDYNQAYDNDFLKLCSVYDGVPEALEKLKSKGVKLAVLTNKPQPTAVKTIEAFFGKNTFDIVFGQKANFPIKPDPSGAFEIISTLKVKKENCVYVGDTSTDMKTGKNAGLFTLGVLWGFRKREELEKNGADAIIENPAEMLKFV